MSRIFWLSVCTPLVIPACKLSLFLVTDFLRWLVPDGRVKDALFREL